MTITEANATVFIALETIDTGDTILRLTAYNTNSQTMLIVRTWQIDGGDHERYEFCQIEAETIAAYWCSLLDTDDFMFGGVIHTGHPANSRIHTAADPLQLIADDALLL